MGNSRHRRDRRRPQLIGIVAALMCAVGLVTFVSTPASGAIDSELRMTKTASGESFQPGDSFTYTLEITCLSNEAPACTGAVLTDSLPAPLVFDPPDASAVSVNYPDATTPPQVTVDGTDLTVDFGQAGIGAGDVLTVSIRVMVPPGIGGDWDGAEVTNTATIGAENADPVPAEDTVTLVVEQTLATEATKSVVPTTTIPAIPGRPVDYTIGGSNESNYGVDALVIQDPSEAPATEPWNYLEFTGLGPITPPTGADTVQFDYFDGTAWVTGTPVSPIPADGDALIPPGTDPASIQGVRFTFTNSEGTLPPSGAGTAAVVVETQTNEDVADLPPNTPTTLDNTSSATVVDGDTTATDTDDAAVTLLNEPPRVEVSKSVSDTQLLPGDQATITLEADNGSRPVHEMTISEPGAPGDPDLVDQGLVFEGFTDGVVWPSDATSAEITYTYEDGTTSTDSTDVPHTLPGPDPDKRVAGFTVTFTSDGDGIDSAAHAEIPFDVTAEPVPGDQPVATTNTTSSTVTTEEGATDDDTDEVDITRLPQVVDVAVSKNIVRDWVYASPGATSSVNLTGSIPEESSSVGSDHLTISDPADPSATPSSFWNVFDLQEIGPVDVPANADLTVEYWDGTSWQTLAGPVIGPEPDWSYTPTADEKEQIEGIRFVFTPKEGELLPPGFNVSPNFTVEVRADYRDGSGPIDLDDDEVLVVDNTVLAEAHNDNAVDPDPTDEDDDSIELRPITGDGPDMVDKVWLDADTGAEVDNVDYIALSEQVHTARIKWGTGGLALDTVEIVDDPSYAAVADSIFDAFDLVRVHPIRPAADGDPLTAVDPLIATDTVRIELYRGGAWVAPVSDPCPSGCAGGFPGYALSADEQADTLAVRLAFVGTSGTVTQSFDNTRPIHLDFRIRDTLRSDDTYVLGTTHPDAVYNNGAAGLVDNTVGVTATKGEDTYTSAADITATIIDRPLNVSVTKEFDQDVLGLPPEGTPADQYPLITATLRPVNDTAAEVRTLSVTDPAPSQADPTAYDVLDLHAIGPIELPAGATQADSRVLLTDELGIETPYSLAAAQALGPDDLADIVSVRVDFQGAGVDVAAGQGGRVDLTYQLRQEKRSGGPVEETDGDLVVNVAEAGLSSPGGVAGSESPTARDDDEFGIEQPTYDVLATKSINPAERFEDESTAYTVTLTGRPTGTARTTELTIADTEATFWNVFDFASVQPVTPPAPVNQLRLDVLVGVTFDVDDAGDLVTLCEGEADLTACWEEGEWVGGSPIALGLPAAVADASQVRGVRVLARSVVAGEVVQWERPANPTVAVTLNVVRRSTLVYGPDGATDTPVPTTRPGLDPAPGEDSAGTVSDTVDVSGVAGWSSGQGVYTGEDTAADDTLLKHRVNRIRVEKTPGRGIGSSDPIYDVGADIPYRLTVTNTGDWTMTGLTVTDQIELVDGSSPLIEGPPTVYTFTLTDAAGQAQPTTGFAAGLNTATGVLTVTTPADFLFPPAWKLVVGAKLRFRPGLPPGTSVGNGVTATSDRPFERCDYTVDANLQQPLTGEVDECTAETHVTVNATSPIVMRKLVKGVGAGDPEAAEGSANYDDLGVMAFNQAGAAACASPADGQGFYAFPCVPVTRPGGLERWKVTFTNSGNVPANVISTIDVLPAPGDTGVTIGTQRNSRWSPVLVGDFESSVSGTQAPHTSSAYYSTTVPTRTCNEADIYDDTRPGGLATTDPCYADVQARTWLPVAGATEAQLAQARAVKVVVAFTDPTQGLQPGQSGSYSFLTRTPWVAPVADSATALPIAWNAVAGGSRRAFTNEQFPQAASLVTEPQKVGVALATGELELQKVVDAPEDFPAELPTSYGVDLACVSGEEDVVLRGSSAGDDRTHVTLPADGTVVDYNADYAVNLPLFADCTATETPAVPGATVTLDPESVTALRDLTGRANIHHPWAAEEEIERLTVTNTFTVGGFTVTKDVDNGGAVDQDGEPIVYDDEFTFDVSCTYLDQEVIPEEEQTLTLSDGESAHYDNVPLGSDCVVSETDAASADSTSATLTVGDGEPQPVEGTEVSFEVTEEDTAVVVAFTNHYLAAPVEISKDLTGPGADAWGNEQFELRMVCTLAAADPDTVFDDTHAVSKADPVWTVENLPVGATCAVTEPGDGGANDVELPDPFVVEQLDGPVTVTVTNVFTLGSLEVRKALTLDGEPATQPPYSTGTYTMTLTCTREVNGATVPVAVPGGPDRTITGAGVARYDGLPTGAECTLAETGSVPAPDSTTIAPAGPYVIGDDVEEPVEVTVTNRFVTGGLQILKEVTGAGAADFGAGPFHFSVVCTLAGTTTYANPDVVLTAAPGAPSVRSEVLAPITVGSRCVVTETDSAGADATPPPVTVTIVRDETTQSVVVAAFVNAFSAGTVELTKTLRGNDADRHRRQEFVIRVTCQREVTAPDGSTTLATLYSSNVRIKGGRTVLLRDADGDPVLLPLGTRCWGEEIQDRGADETSIDHDSYENGAVVTAGSPEDLQTLTIEAVNTFTRDRGTDPDDDPGDDPSDDPGADPGDIPDAGGPAWWWLVLGGTLLLAGALLLLRDRRGRPEA